MDRSLCAKATAENEQPTPGYMYNEIARITHASVDACRQLEEYLIKRLQKDSVHVKLKALRVIKHCCLHGHMTFRRDMQSKTMAIKEMMQYRGAADPLHGDNLNRAVRETAQEVMNAVFDSTTPSEQLLNAGRLQGFGSESGPGTGPGGDATRFGSISSSLGNMCNSIVHTSSAAGAAAQGRPPRLESGAYSTGRMQGFGNPNFDHSSGPDSGGGRLAAIASGISESVSRLKFPIGSSVAGGGVGGTFSSGGYGPSATGQGGHGFGDTYPNAGSYSHPYQPSAFADAPPTQPAPEPPRPSFADPRPTPTTSLASSSTGRDTTSMSLEEKLVDEATEPGGMRATIPRDELRKFCTAVTTLNGQRVAQALGDKLSAPEWQRRLRALCIMEALVKEGGEEMAGLLRAHLAAVVQLQQSAQVSVKDRATKVLVLLGHEGEDSPAPVDGAVEGTGSSAPARRKGGNKKKGKAEAVVGTASRVPKQVSPSPPPLLTRPLAPVPPAAQTS